MNQVKDFSAITAVTFGSFAVLLGGTGLLTTLSIGQLMSITSLVCSLALCGGMGATFLGGFHINKKIQKHKNETASKVDEFFTGKNTG